ncbi:DUF6221 family protein [Streptomyces sp. H49]|uniref:DUF6221 family protein n=1 Tax=Streptomyces sp. H49 TaxID=3444117 RepID=UPI003F4AAE8F
MDDLLNWLCAQLDKDEQIAQQAGNRRWLVQDNIIELYPEREDDGFMSWPIRSDARHAANWDPARVLREIDAKRRIVEQHRPVGYGDVCLSYCHTRTPSQPQTWPCLTLRLVALPYGPARLPRGVAAVTELANLVRRLTATTAASSSDILDAISALKSHDVLLPEPWSEETIARALPPSLRWPQARAPACARQPSASVLLRLTDARTMGPPHDRPRPAPVGGTVGRPSRPRRR